MPGKFIEPLVSVVIPTFQRPKLVARAVHSALNQTLRAIEVIVVLDGPDEETLKVLSGIDDARLRVHILRSHCGANDARNAGVGEARSRWVALLDDDDEWLPVKLEIQLRTASQSSHSNPIISCRLISPSEAGDLLWPLRFPRKGEDLSEYLFCRSTPFGGEGLIQTSTIFTTKELLQKVPFKSGLKKLQDFDWLLRVNASEGSIVEFVPTSEPMLIWHREDLGRTVSTVDLSYYLSWIQENMHLFTPRAYASFIMTYTSEKALRRGKWRAFFPLLLKAYKHGKPTILDTLIYFGIWLIPMRVRIRLAAAFVGKFDKRRSGLMNVEV